MTIIRSITILTIMMLLSITQAQTITTSNTQLAYYQNTNPAAEETPTKKNLPLKKKQKVDALAFSLKIIIGLAAITAIIGSFLYYKRKLLD